MKYFSSFAMSFTFVMSALAAEPILVIRETSNQIFMDITHSYKTPWKISDIDQAIDPKNGHIQELFKDPIRVEQIGNNRYKVVTSSGIPIYRVTLKGNLDYNYSSNKDLGNYKFNFHDFDNVFNYSVISVETKTSGSDTLVNIRQNAEFKADFFRKLKSFGGVSVFKSKILSNVKAFQKGTGGGVIKK